MILFHLEKLLMVLELKKVQYIAIIHQRKQY